MQTMHDEGWLDILIANKFDGNMEYGDRAVDVVANGGGRAADAADTRERQRVDRLDASEPTAYIEDGSGLP